jgi:dCMP deaminase
MRLSFKDTLMNMALELAEGRADCTRRKVACAIYNPSNYDIIDWGYNGAPRGMPGCLTDGACPRGRHYEVEIEPTRERVSRPAMYRRIPACACGNAVWPCPDAVEPGSSYDTGKGACNSVHAEQNGIGRASFARCRFMSMVVTEQPCDGCLKLIRAAEIWHVYWPGGEHNFEPAFPRIQNVSLS